MTYYITYGTTCYGLWRGETQIQALAKLAKARGLSPGFVTCHFHARPVGVTQSRHTISTPLRLRPTWGWV